MDIPAVKGTRDFYPQTKAVHNWIIETWKRVSRRSGFVEYDGPILEHLELFTIKSGEEIVSQLFSLTDRGGRQLAIRPEITPTLARMINQRVNSLRKPIKWFSVPRLCRAERPQRGRLREFFQWNIDIVGSDEPLADAECVFVAVDALREFGLTPADVVVKVSSRTLVGQLLQQWGVAVEKMEQAFAVLDKLGKLDDSQFLAFASEKLQLDSKTALKMLDLRRVDNLEAIGEIAHSRKSMREALEPLERMIQILQQMGVGDYVRFDLSVVRGLAYYTGMVFEIFDRSEKLRAIAGGGRYDQLTNILGGPRLPAVGFGMGDVVLELVLAEKGKIPQPRPRTDVFLIDEQPQAMERLLWLAGRMRQAGLSVVFSYKRQSIRKQLQQANEAGARYAVFVGSDTCRIKDMCSGDQKDMSFEQLLALADGYARQGKAMMET